eukprot:m.254882 g.254882  ORF g.254882 m.254882 type:complete len:259 (+) comp18798_c0_seq1:299-1075(+)
MTKENLSAVLHQHFKSAYTISDIIAQVAAILKGEGFVAENTLPAVSFCSDEINRSFGKLVGRTWRDPFTIGGLAGFPFGGRTGFAAWSQHRPSEDGHLLLIVASHVGIARPTATSPIWEFGACDRQDVAEVDKACGAAIAAYYKPKPKDLPRLHDLQQRCIEDIVASHRKDIDSTADASTQMAQLATMMAEVNYAEALAIIPEEFNGCPIAILGGVHINAPPGIEDFFVPLHFEIRETSGSRNDIKERLDKALKSATA